MEVTVHIHEGVMARRHSSAYPMNKSDGPNSSGRSARRNEELGVIPRLLTAWGYTLIWCVWVTWIVPHRSNLKPGSLKVCTA